MALFGLFRWKQATHQDIEVIPDYFGDIIGFYHESSLLFFSGEHIQAYDLYSGAIIFEQANPEDRYRGLQLSNDSSQVLLNNRNSGAIENMGTE